MTDMNAHDLPAMLQLLRDEQLDKFYFSHLNYAGRGNIHRARDAQFGGTRAALDLLFDTAWRAAQAGEPTEFVTGNNDADGVYLLLWVREHLPQWEHSVREHLQAWGGNSSGVNVANIDNLGHVHPDTMWWHRSLGDVRQRPFSEIWQDVSLPLMAGLKAHPRKLGGRCGACSHLSLCNGSSRVRAEQVTGDVWGEDPGCFLTDAEIGVEAESPRVAVTPFAHRKIPVLLQSD
ncbi:MAG: heme d1 biosynthesis radical SAM protein NirJ, partial [Burkholderiales bacterium]